MIMFLMSYKKKLANMMFYFFFFSLVQLDIFFRAGSNLYVDSKN